MLRTNNITYSGKLDLRELKYINLRDNEIERYTVRRGDILFNRTNSAELVGKTAVFDENEPYAFAGYLVRLRTNAASVPEYISTFLNSPYGKSVLRHKCKSIIGMANINAKEVQTIRIPAPPISLQKEYAKNSRLVVAAYDKQRKSLIELDALFASLQDRAFRGLL